MMILSVPRTTPYIFERTTASNPRGMSVLLLMSNPSDVTSERLKVAAPTYLYSGPSPTASLATTISAPKRPTWATARWVRSAPDSPFGKPR